MRFYIDPGTGSMLFTILIGVLGAAMYALREGFIKLRFYLSGGKAKQSVSSVPYAIFTDSKRYWAVFEPICNEFERRGVDLLYMTASPDDPALNKEFKHVRCQFIGAGNNAYAKLNMLKSDILLSSTPGLDVYQWKRSRDVKYYVHIPHAIGDITTYRMFGLDYYDAVLLSGEYQIDQIRALEKLRGLPAKELLIVGQPYMDAMLTRLENEPPLPEEKPVTVLLAPSWGPSGILKRFGAEMIDALLATGYHIVVRPHPQSFTSEKNMIEDLMRRYPDSEQLEWNRDNDNFDVLYRSDVMISDFSGVIFDFSLVFGKPVIYADTSYDKSPYDACWLDEELWTFKALPQVGIQLTKDSFPLLPELIEECLNNLRFREARSRLCQETWQHIGESAALTADYLISKHDQLMESAEVPNAALKP